MSEATWSFKLPKTTDLSLTIDGLIAVGGNAKGKYPIEFTANAVIPDPADKALCGGQDLELKTTVQLEVPPPTAEITVSDEEAYPDEEVVLSWSIRNTGQVQDQFSYEFTVEPPEQTEPPVVAIAAMRAAPVQQAALPPAPQPTFALRFLGHRQGNGPYTQSASGGCTLESGAKVTGKVRVLVIGGGKGDIGRVTLSVKARGDEVGAKKGEIKLLPYELWISPQDVTIGAKRSVDTFVIVHLRNNSPKRDIAIQGSVTVTALTDAAGAPLAQSEPLSWKFRVITGEIEGTSTTTTFALNAPRNEEVQIKLPVLVLSNWGSKVKPEFPIDVQVTGTENGKQAPFDVKTCKVYKEPPKENYSLSTPTAQPWCSQQLGQVEAYAFADPELQTGQLRLEILSKTKAGVPNAIWARKSSGEPAGFQRSPMQIDWNSRAFFWLYYDGEVTGAADAIQIAMFKGNEKVKELKITVNCYALTMDPPIMCALPGEKASFAMKPAGAFAYEVIDANNQASALITAAGSQVTISAEAKDGEAAGNFTLSGNHQHANWQGQAEDCKFTCQFGALHMKVRTADNADGIYEKEQVIVLARKTTRQEIEIDVRGPGTVYLEDTNEIIVTPKELTSATKKVTVEHRGADKGADGAPVVINAQIGMTKEKKHPYHAPWKVWPLEVLTLGVCRVDVTGGGYTAGPLRIGDASSIWSRQACVAFSATTDGKMPMPQGVTIPMTEPQLQLLRSAWAPQRTTPLVVFTVSRVDIRSEVAGRGTLGFWGVVVGNTGNVGSVLAHEIGHNFGLGGNDHAGYTSGDLMNKKGASDDVHMKYEDIPTARAKTRQWLTP